MTWEYADKQPEKQQDGTPAPPLPPSIVTNAGRFQWITIGNLAKWLYSRGTHGELARNVAVLESLLSPTLTRESMDRVYDIRGAVVSGESRRTITVPVQCAYLEHTCAHMYVYNMYTLCVCACVPVSIDAQARRM